MDHLSHHPLRTGIWNSDRCMPWGSGLGQGGQAVSHLLHVPAVASWRHSSEPEVRLVAGELLQWFCFMHTQHRVHNCWLHPAPSQGKDARSCVRPSCLQEQRKSACSLHCPHTPLLKAAVSWGSWGFPHFSGDGRGRWGAEGPSACANRTRDLFLLPQVMVPSLDDIQQAINRMIQLTLEVSRGVAHWGQQPTRPMKNLKVSPSRTTDLAHPSGGKQLKREESKNATSQTDRVSELQCTSALLGPVLGPTACRYFYK